MLPLPDVAELWVLLQAFGLVGTTAIWALSHRRSSRDGAFCGV
jgi:hypothetical protein